MEERHDILLAEKIKDTVYNHIEPYTEGAWENFLSKKKKKKRRVFYWYLTGVASSLLILVLLNFLSQRSSSIPNEESNPQIIDGTKETNPLPNKKLDKVLQTEMAGIQKERKNQEPNNSIKKSNEIGKGKDINPTKSNQLQVKIPSQMSGIKTSADSLSLVFDLDSLINDDNEIVSFEEEIEELNSGKEEGKVKKMQDLEFALQLASSISATNPDTGNGKSQNFGAGVLVDIPIKSGFSVNTGIVFNTLKQSNVNSFVPTMEGTEKTQRSTSSEANQYNLDIPTNLVYTFQGKKNNFYILSGFSSYVTLKEQRELTTETIREIEIFREVDGVLESFIETESVINSSSLKEGGGKFFPLATINLSIGYRANLSEKVKYEIQPFYKIPIHSLIVKDLKTPMAGVALKVVFIK